MEIICSAAEDDFHPYFGTTNDDALSGFLLNKLLPGWFLQCTTPCIGTNIVLTAAMLL
jgi:hypothetical protein